VLKRDGERGGERVFEHIGWAAERAERISCWSRGRRESDGVAQIVKIIHFFQSRTTLTRASRKRSCTLEQNWYKTGTELVLPVRKKLAEVICCDFPW
jgi:hypothetical protein